MCLWLSKALQLGFFLWELKIINWLKSIKKKRENYQRNLITWLLGLAEPCNQPPSFLTPLSGYVACFPVICLRGCVLVTQSCLTLCNPMDCSPPSSSVHGILQARILEWVTMPFSRGSSWPRDQTQVYRIAGRFSLASNINDKCGVLIHHTFEESRSD